MKRSFIVFNRLRSVVLPVLLAMMQGAVVFGQDIPAQSVASPFHAGFRGDYLRNFHPTSSEIVDDCPVCGTFTNGDGGGYEFQLFGEVPFNFFRRLDLDFGAGIVQRGGSFGVTATDELPIYNENTGQNAYTQLHLQHNFTASLIYIDLSGGVRFDPIKHFAGYCSATFDAGIPAGSSTSYKQTQTILSPSGYLFPGANSTTLTVGQGQIEGINTLFGMTGLVGYELPFGPVLTAAPELSYYVPLNSVATTRPWHVSSLSLGVAIRWNQPPKGGYEEPPPVPEKPLPPPIVAREDRNAFAPKLAAESLAAEPLHIVETTVTETFPILPYIFFDSASATIPDRFAQITPSEADRFKESDLPHRSLESYYQILNVIGNRLRENASALLTINGTTDGHEAMDEQRLAENRANAVRDYLIKIWNIEPKRLIVATSDKPHNPSSTQYAEGFEENRRVELSSDDDRILKPIVHERFREESALPKSLPLSLNASSSVGVRNWRLRIFSKKNSIFETSGEGSPSPLNWQLTDGQIESLAKTLTSKDSLVLHFEADATNGAHSEEEVPLAASKTINPFELGRLSLIVFDFDQSKIGSQNERMISQFVAKSFYPASKATIIGSTDNLGELPHNQTLSEARAFNVRDLILADKPDATITSAKGIGPSNLLYDNHLPEGRYYCRTVRVEVETPLESILTGQK